MKNKDTLALRFLYNTIAGRCVLKMLVSPPVSAVGGYMLSKRSSRLLIKPFMKKNRVNLHGIAVPEGGFSSFNDFFTRKRKHIEFDSNADSVCSPCDGLLKAFDIDKNSCFDVKHSHYSLAELLKDRVIAEKFQGGTALIFRLTPSHYHRYHFPDSGRMILHKRIPGVLHCVRPVAINRFPVYVQNSREYTLYGSENFGDVVQMEVGALMVGRIKNHPFVQSFLRGQEKGCFEFGGSTIIMLFEKDRVKLGREFYGHETPVIVGQRIGEKAFNSALTY